MSSIARVIRLALIGFILTSGRVRAGFVDEVFQGCFGIRGTKDYAPIYDDIEETLQALGPSGDSIQRQMDEIEKLLADKKAPTKQKCHRVAALEQIVELKNAVGHLQCTPQSVQILSNNTLATRNKARLVKTTRRIDALVKHYLQTHAKACNEKYVNRFGAMIAFANHDHLERVHGYCNSVMDKLLKGRTTESARPDVAIGHFKLSENKMAAATLNYLKSVVYYREKAVLRSSTNMPKSERKSLIGDIVRIYLVEPCKYYLKTINGYVFDLFDFDLQASDSVPANADFDFFKGRANRLICEALVEEESKSLSESIFRAVTQN